MDVMPPATYHLFHKKNIFQQLKLMPSLDKCEDKPQKLQAGGGIAPKIREIK